MVQVVTEQEMNQVNQTNNTEHAPAYDGDRIA